MKIYSSVFKDNDFMPKECAYKSGNSAPPLGISEVHSAAASLCLVVHDPDAPSGDFIHWLMWNIKPDTTSINSLQIPIGAIQGLNDFGNYRWDGPSPLSGTHHYIFDLYALNTTFDINKDIAAKDLLNLVNLHKIANSSLTGLYSA